MTDEQLLLSALGLDSSGKFPHVLYHYTSMEALLSIVSSGRIRATHIRYLNDYSEIEWLWDNVAAQLKRKLLSASTSDQSAHAAALLELAEKRRQLNEFVASFSENGDDLTQWRAYCPRGSGLSIGFEAAALQTQWVADPNGGEPSFVGGRVARVRYLSPGDTTKFDEQLDTLIDVVPSITQTFQGSASKEQMLMAWLSVIAPTFKHPAFSSENEWRMILTKPHKPMPGQRFRPGKSSIVPYVEVILNRDLASKPPVNYMINRVIIGPTPNPELSREALQTLFATVGHPEVQVEMSAIPYRHW